MISTRKVLGDYSCILFLFLSISSLFPVETKGSTRKIIATEKKSLSQKVSTVLVFGDSTVDPGNNNYISTPFKGNFPPYGRDFMDQSPTGRFTNGRLPTDFIAEYLGVKEYVPPYLDPTLSTEELMSGVSFASAGSGFDPLTPKISNVIPISQQIEYFKDYKSRLAATIGEEETENLIKNALILVSAGTNDFVVNYLTVPIRRKYYSISTYIDFCLQNVQHFLQELLDLGAQRIGMAGLPPMGCLPLVITLYADNPFIHRGCLSNISYIAEIYNQKLQILLQSTQNKLREKGNKSGIGYLDIYGPLTDMTAQPQKYGFETIDSGCCGTGILEVTFLCNSKSYVCPDASKYMYFDSIHPSERSYSFCFQAIQPTIDSLVQLVH